MVVCMTVCMVDMGGLVGVVDDVVVCTVVGLAVDIAEDVKVGRSDSEY